MAISVQLLTAGILLDALNANSMFTILAAVHGLQDEDENPITPTDVWVDQGCSFLIVGNDVVIINPTGADLVNVQVRITQQHSIELPENQADVPVVTAGGVLIATTAPALGHLIKGTGIATLTAISPITEAQQNITPVVIPGISDLFDQQVLTTIGNEIVIQVPGTYIIDVSFLVLDDTLHEFLAELRRSPGGVPSQPAGSGGSLDQSGAAVQHGGLSRLVGVVEVTQAEIDGAIDNIFDIILFKDVGNGDGGDLVSGVVQVTKI